MGKNFNNMDELEIRLPDKPNSPSVLPIIILMFIFPPVSIFLIFKKVYAWYKGVKIEDYRRIASVMRHRQEISLTELAEITGRPYSALVTDVRNMFETGCFGSAYYLDEKAGVIRCEHVRTEAPKAREVKHVEETVSATPEQPKKTAGVAAKAAEQPPVAARFEGNLRRIRELNDSIKDEAISAKIDQIGLLTAGIFSVVQYMPEREGEIRKFMDYYLPTTFKLLETYALMEKQSYKSKDMIESMKRISGIMDSLIKAFEEQQARLMRSDALNVDAEISALETILAQDGLVLPKGADINDFLRTQN